jgi:prevent-host-death family protein
MATNSDANRISLADASARGLPELVSEAEEGREQIIVRDDRAVAVVISAERYERLQRLGASREEPGDDSGPAPDEVQPGSPTKNGGGFRRVDPKAHPLLGKWRIVEMELWDRNYLDMEEPAYIAFNERGGGEFVFGLVYGGLSCGYSPTSIDFTWEGNDEMEEALGDGWAELQDDGTVAGEIRFHAGDESGFRAHRW